MPSPSPDPAPPAPKAVAFLLLSIGCGLAAGLSEVLVIAVRRWADRNGLAPMPRDYIWQVPVADLAILFGLGVSILPMLRSGARGRWLSTRILGTLTLLPPIWAAAPGIYGLAGLLLATGLSVRLVPLLECRPAVVRRMVRIGLPLLAATLMLLGGSLRLRDQLAAWSEERRPLPASGHPSVLLIVLDTVAADHLHLYGYDRPTSTTLDELSGLGLRFERARATAPWTLPSHGSMFTGRWPHELSAGWLTPLDDARPTLAEYLGTRGYATAGFVANYWYCASNSGLGRGFATYRDYIFPRLTAFKPAALVDRTVEGLRSFDRLLVDWLDVEVLGSAVESLYRLCKFNRKSASTVNREFLEWLSRRGQPERPFFAFLNYYDAHHPYRLPEMGIHRFGVEPDERAAIDPFEDDAPLPGVPPSPEQLLRSRDDYDNCVADLDEHLGRLMDELGRRGILSRTWVIIVADHGESFGEHAGVYRHGSSLYRTELDVPLLILPPSGATAPAPASVREPVSLRDIAATVVDLAGFGEGSPFPGASLIRFARGDGTGHDDPEAREAPLSEVVPLDAKHPDPSQWREPHWPMAALADGAWTYIRREGGRREELFDIGRDGRETRNLADDPALQPTLDRMRNTLDGLTGGPLTPDRFAP